LGVLFAINAVNFYDRSVLGAVGEEIRREWSLSDSTLGLLNAAFTLLYAVVGVPFGYWADRGNRVRLLVLGVTAWSLLTALSGACRNFAELFLVRLGVGVGEATCAPAASSLIGDLFPASRRARANSIFMLGLPVGIASAFFVSGLIVQRFGWRVAFLVAGLPGILCALAALRISEPLRTHVDGGAAGGTRTRGAAAWPRWDAVRQVLSIPTLWSIVVSGALYNCCIYSIAGFLVPYLRRFHQQDPWSANLASTVSFGLTGIPGLLLAGWAADWAIGRSDKGRLWLGALAMLAAAPPWFLALAQPAGSIGPFSVYVAIGCGLMYFYYTAVYTTIQDIVPAQLRGTAVAIYFCAMYLFGASFGPWLAGSLSDMFSVRAAAAAGVAAPTPAMLEPFRAAGLRAAMRLIPLLLLALAGVLWIASLTVGRDLQRARNAVART
jgi:MFS family permease